jgi:hypothetical protein
VTEQPSIIIPGADSPATLAKLLEGFAARERVCTVIVRRGERFLLKVTEVRKELLVGEVRCLHWSPEMGRRIWQDGRKERWEGEGRREVTLADAIDAFGNEAHRYRVYLPLDEITAVYEDLDDRFDQTPFLPLP